MRLRLMLLTLVLLAPTLAVAQDADHDMRCDLNGDGRVGPNERDRCAAVLRACDADHDGRLSDDERANCREKADDARPDGHDRPMGHSDECRAKLEQVQARRDALQGELRERRARFSAEADDAARRFANGNRTEDEWRAFHAEWREKREAIEAEVRGRLEAFEEEARSLAAACRHDHAAGAPGPACRPDESEFARFRAVVDEKERTLRSEVESHLEGIRARHEAALRAFRAENHTEEEIEAFRHRQVEARALLEAELHELAARHRAAVEAQWRDFEQKHARACVRDHLEERRDLRDTHVDARGERVACQLQIQATIDEFVKARDRARDDWTAEDRRSFERVEAEIRNMREACEARIHAEWKDAAHAAIREKAREERFGSFVMHHEAENTGTVEGRYVSFHAEGPSVVIRDYSVQGALVFERFEAPHEFIEARAEGSVMGVVARIDGVDLKLRIHDNPTGSFDARCPEEGMMCRLVFGDATVTAANERDGDATRFVVETGGRRVVVHLNDAYMWSGGTLEFQGGARVLVPGQSFALDKVANKARDEINTAVVQGTVLAEVSVVLAGDDLVSEFVPYDVPATDGDHDEAPAASDPCAAEEGAVKFELEGLQCGVVRPTEGGKGVSLVVSAESAEPKTLVFNLDAALFAVEGGLLKADDVVVDYYDVDASGAAVKVDISKATDLADVLLPDEDVPEYWIILDEDGLQLLVSNSHFSAKRIDVRAAEPPAGGGTTAEGATSPDARTPLPVIVALAALAAAAIVAGRRRA